VDEKRKAITENILLDNELTSIKYELEKLKKENENENLNNLKSHTNSLIDIKSEEYHQSKNKLLICNLKMKIEELEDLIAQQTSMMDPLKIAELEKTISEDCILLAGKNNYIEQLKSKIQEILKKPNFIFDENQAVHSLTQAMREKDVLILDLKKALRDFKENNYRSDLISNERNQYNNLKDKYGNIFYIIFF
jgi:hypothetical protein